MEITSKKDDRLLRAAEVEVLVGDASKARRRLGWKPRYAFGNLVTEMVQADLRALDEKP